MAPNNSDNKIKNLINNRQIEPSAQAWDRLDAMLTVAEKKKPKTKFWLSIAASFFVIMGLGYFFITLNNSQTSNNNFQLPNNNNNVVVVDTAKKEETDKKENAEKNNPVPLKLMSPTEKLLKKIKNEYKAVKTSGLATTEKPLNVNKNEVLTPENKNTVTKNEEKTENNILQKSTTNNTVLASNTEAETYKYKRKPVTINPNDLLETTDKELNQTFRERAWKRIQRASSAFASRNYE